jgi:CRP-like cAMP-binding protein
MNGPKLVEILANIDFLRGASHDHLEQIASVAQVCDYEKSDLVFSEGEVADSVYLVVSGKLSLELAPATIYHKYLVEVGRGEMLGWSTFVDHPRYAATAVVVEPTRLVRIDGRRLRAICDENPQFGYEFLRRAMLALAKRLRATWSQLSQVYLSHQLPLNAPCNE